MNAVKVARARIRDIFARGKTETATVEFDPYMADAVYEVEKMLNDWNGVPTPEKSVVLRSQTAPGNGVTATNRQLGDILYQTEMYFPVQRMPPRYVGSPAPLDKMITPELKTVDNAGEDLKKMFYFMEGRDDDSIDVGSGRISKR